MTDRNKKNKQHGHRYVFLHVEISGQDGDKKAIR